MYRPLRRIDKQEFCQDILQSLLYGPLQSDADEFGNLFKNAELTCVLDIHALLRSGRCHCRGQHLERRYRRSGLRLDKQPYNAACKAASDSYTMTCADHIKTQMEQASGNIQATWRTAQTLLHRQQKVVHDDAECADLVSKFSQFFVDKVRCIRDSITSAL